MRDLRRRHHPRCVVCGRGDAGLDLDFQLTEDGRVEAALVCGSVWQGYPDRLHGGMICTVLDAAMTHCLFAHGLAAFTAELNVRFRRAAALECAATVRAWISERQTPLFRLAAEVVQDGLVVASAQAAFIDSAAAAGLAALANPPKSDMT